MEEVETLESRHKKEKRELQAQITALKKAAKNDKSKKKELITEVVRLETEMENRQQKELEDLQGKIPPADSVDGAEDYFESEQAKVKVSKAQKRRDKKSQQEKEREAEIKLQEAENRNGPRNLEIQAITTKLKKKNIQLYPIPSDGDCLYKAVSHQLQITRNSQVTVDELRDKTANYIRQNKDDFIPFMSHPETCEMLTDEEFEEYCSKISDTKVWGGQVEIRALSNSLKCPIKVVQATGPESIDQGMEYDGAPLVITYHRHIYKLGEHYNSTQPITENNDKND